MELHIAVVTFLVDLFYNQVSLGGYKIGLYPVFALVPGLGDIISLFLSAYMLWIASELQIPAWKRGQMIANILFDLSFGAIPIAGDLIDTVFRAHIRNLSILYQYKKQDIIEGEVVNNK